MAITNIELLKQHVRADDFAEDDDYLQHLLDAAEEHVQQATNRTGDELIQMGDGHQYPAAIQHAVIMIAGHWYNQREAVSVGQMSEVPYSIQALIKPYRKLV